MIEFYETNILKNSNGLFITGSKNYPKEHLKVETVFH